MSTLRERIEAHMAALRAERAVAEAAITDQPSGEWLVCGETVMAFDGSDWAWVIASMNTDVTGEDLDHIALQDPAATVARIDRELAGCAADLALLTSAEESGAVGGVLFRAFSEAVLRNLAARYPEGAS